MFDSSAARNSIEQKILIPDLPVNKQNVLKLTVKNYFFYFFYIQHF